MRTDRVFDPLREQPNFKELKPTLEEKAGAAKAQ
jgi:hypothetical protein